MLRVEVTLPGQASSVPSARRFAVRTLEAWGLPAVGWSAAVVVTELASNAVLHARTEFDVAVVRLRDAVRLEVTDRARTAPRPRTHGPDATTGRGLLLVAELARTWGTQPAPDGPGKTVWCELPMPAAADLPGRGVRSGVVA